MFIVLFVILAIVGAFLAYYIYEKTDDIGVIGRISLVISVVSIVVVMISLPIAIVKNASPEGRKASYEQTYEALTYQLENNLYDNDNDLGKSDLYNQVRAWNEDLAKNKIMQSDFWFGCFYPNIYDDFKFIEYPDA